MPKRAKTILKEYFGAGATPTGAAFTELIDSLEDNLAPTTLTIAGGVVTRTQRRHKVDTEGQASTDDLDTINGLADGEELILRIVAAGRTVVLKDGTGNIDIASDFSMSTTRHVIHLWYNGDDAKLQEIARNS